MRSIPASSSAKNSSVPVSTRPVPSSTSPSSTRRSIISWVARGAGGGAQERVDRLDRRLGDVVAQRAGAGDDEGVTAHPQRGLPDSVDELGVGVEHGVEVVPHAGGGGQPLAAATLGGSGRVDLVGRAADDDEFAGQLLAQRRQGQRGADDRAGDQAVAAGVDRLGRAVLAHGRDRVVERGDADTAAGAPARQRRAERGAEPGHALLDAQARVAQPPRQVGRAPVLLVRQLGMRVHERDGVCDRRPLRRDGGDELRVGNGHAQTLTRTFRRDRLAWRGSERETRLGRTARPKLAGQLSDRGELARRRDADEGVEYLVVAEHGRARIGPATPVAHRPGRVEQPAHEHQRGGRRARVDP